MISSKRAPIGRAMPRPQKRVSGRTSVTSTPLSVRTSGIDVTPELRRYVHARLGFRLGKFARHIERVTARFEDVNGPRGGVDTACRIKVVVSGLPSMVVEELASDAEVAFNRAGDRIERVVRRSLGRARGHGRLASVRAPRGERSGPRTGAVVGAIAMGRATGARNFKRNPRRAKFALETSAGPRPSRKSTRKSANRMKHGNKLQRRQVRRVSSPKSRKAQSSRRR